MKLKNRQDNALAHKNYLIFFFLTNGCAHIFKNSYEFSFMDQVIAAVEEYFGGLPKNF